MSERDTNLKMRGRLVADPRLINTVTNKLFCEFSLCYQPNKRYEAVFIDFVSNRKEVSEYLAANYKKGDEVRVLSATPLTRKGKDGRKYVKWTVWDVALKELDSGSAASDDDSFGDEPPY